MKFSFAGGYEDTRIENNQYAIDLMDRTAVTPGWVVMRPLVGQSSNCIFPDYVAAALVVQYGGGGEGNPGPQACGIAYNAGKDPVTGQPLFRGHLSDGARQGPISRPIIYPGFDPSTAPNGVRASPKSSAATNFPTRRISRCRLSADYTMPVSPDWAATLHSDFYWQSQSWARVQNDDPYDQIHGYTNVNLALILTRCDRLAGDGLCEEYLRHHRHHRRFPEQR